LVFGKFDGISKKIKYLIKKKLRKNKKVKRGWLS